MAGKGNPKKTRTISPRLANGDIRDSIGHRLPPEVKQGLKTIALHENKSVGWVLEEIIIEYFGFKRPKYITRKKNNG
ncbi:MAG TPA: hypothetical protein VE971_03840 [Candidatus Eisenbacteria bacterium]|nr:hypothetical protein [Candidatus Eisenbacteria bacterium]